MINGYLVHFIGLLLAFLISAYLALFFGNRAVWGSDYNIGPQKIHNGLVPRIGGLAVFVSFMLQLVLGVGTYQSLPWLIMAMAIPVFLVGFLEDVTAKVTPLMRFLVSMITGLLFVWFTGYSITRVDMNLIDSILSIGFISIFLTVLSLAGLANAMNIIDGLNGLASGIALFICAAIVFVSISFDDHEFMFIGLSLASALVGFVVWNFPKGRVFLGDGGAYFVGAIVAGLVIALPERHSDISPFFSLSLVSYPIYELLRTVLRRSLVSGRQAFAPDNQHLHSLLYQVVSKRTNFSSTSQNALASACMLTFPLILIICSISNHSDTPFLVGMLIAFIFIYEMMAMVLNFFRKKI